jgi:ribosome assembly protein YihI (activator of Der GTPase)
MTTYRKNQKKSQNHQSGSNRAMKNASSLSTSDDKKDEQLASQVVNEKKKMVWKISEENEEWMTRQGEQTASLSSLTAM